MSRFVLFFLIIISNLNVSKGILLIGKRIEKGQFPWLVQFQTVIPCGGVLVSPDWVLTAAQCVQDDRQSILLRAVGLNETESFQVIKVKHAYIFPKFKKYDYDSNIQDLNNNIALIKLMRPFNLCDSAEFHFLDLGPHNLDETYKSCFIFGWQSYVGPSKKVVAEPIQYSQIVLNSWKYCAYVYKGNTSFSNVFCTMVKSQEEMLACAGNPGTPVICQDKNEKMLLLGIASWTKFSFDCGGLPSYLNTNVFRGWMNEILLNANKNSKMKPEICNNKELSSGIDTRNVKYSELRNQFSDEDVAKILDETKKYNISNMKKKSLVGDLETMKNSQPAKNNTIDKTNDYVISNYDYDLVENVNEREENHQNKENHRNERNHQNEKNQNPEIDLKSIETIKEVNTKKIVDDTDELLPFTIDDESPSCGVYPFVNIFFFKYELIILTLIFIYFSLFS